MAAVVSNVRRPLVSVFMTRLLQLGPPDGSGSHYSDAANIEESVLVHFDPAQMERGFFRGRPKLSPRFLIQRKLAGLDPRYVCSRI